MASDPEPTSLRQEVSTRPGLVPLFTKQSRVVLSPTFSRPVNILFEALLRTIPNLLLLAIKLDSLLFAADWSRYPTSLLLAVTPDNVLLLDEAVLSYTPLGLLLAVIPDSVLFDADWR